MINVISMSGGKDSGATYLLALEKGIDFLPVFADTGNEHELTYEYVKTFHEKTGGPKIKIIKPDFSSRIIKKRKFIANDHRKKKKRYKVIKDSVISYKVKKLRYSNKQKRRILEYLKPSGNPFLDLCILKGRFPSTRARFCSQELKNIAIYNHVFEPLLENQNIIISWQGVRADESKDREKLQFTETDQKDNRIIHFRPLLKWGVEKVFDIHRKHNVEPNPLYKQGFGRVGCFPCLHCRKEEIRNIANRHPSHIDRIEEWEKVVGMTSKRGVSTFFSADKTPGEGDTRSHIRNVVKWSKTLRGGKQYEMFAEEITECSSIYGLCE